MRLFDFLRKEIPKSWTPLIVLTAVSGVANGALLALINAGATAAASDEQSVRLLLMYMLAFGVFFVAKKTSLTRSMLVVEGMVKNLRVRVCDKLRRAELPFVERLGRGQLYTTISQDANLISQSAFMVTNASQEAIMLVFALLYVAWLSPLAFVIIVVSVGAALLFYYQHQKSLTADLGRLAQKEAEFVDSLGHIVDGFKEAKLSRRKNASLFDSFRRVADDAADLKMSLGVKFVTDIMFSQVFFYLLIGVIVFLLPRLVPTFSDVVLKMTAAVLFIIAPLEMIVNAMPGLARANVALDNMYALEGRLDEHLDAAPEAGAADPGAFSGFKAITLEAVTYSYADAGGESFTVGPVDLSVGGGELLFLVGGNGSGKSTLLKVLTGLYPFQSGALRVDRRAVSEGNVQSYRELFSAIFTDFHLFDRFYGLEGVDEGKVAELIREMELEEKTRYVNGRFSNLNLSTGQKKRLALIIALLEDKEVYVFDEWAADQDVHFREYFYQVILKNLRARGKTVIAVTHDDRYWGEADRVVKMEYGRIVEEQTNTREEA